MKKNLKRLVGITMMFVLLCGHGKVYAALQEGGENGTGSGMNFADIFLAQDISKYRSSDVYTYPEKEGYVFAGWFTDTSYQTAISKDTRTGKYFPKFVDEEVLTIRYQLIEGTNAQSSKTNLRLITSVDNLKYESIGFNINGTEKVSNTVYQAIKGYTKDGTNNYAPSDVFHDTSAFFATYTLTDALNEINEHGTGDDFGLTVEVVPQWTTKDGTTVKGKSASFEINDTLYDSELHGSSHLWGTLAENLNSASASTVDATIDMLRNGTVTAASSCAANLSAGDSVNVTVNGNGKTVTTAGASDIFSIESDIVWNDLTIIHGGSASLFTLNDDCDFTLKQVEITGTSTSVGEEAAIIATGEHCNTAHVVETIEEGTRTVADEIETTLKTTDTFIVTTEDLLANGQDKTVNISISDSNLDATVTSGAAGIRVMRGTIAHINLTDSSIDTKDTLPVYITGSDENYPTWRGMAYITADSASKFSQGDTNVTTAAIKEKNAGMVALQEYTNRVIILTDPHYMAEEDEEDDLGLYYQYDDFQGFSLGHTQADRMKNILLDIKGFQNRQTVDSILVLGDLSTDNYPTNQFLDANGTFDKTATYVYKFKNDVMSKFETQFGITSWALAGNHDSYPNEKWSDIMGYDRQYAKEIGNAVFIMLDNYVAENNTNRNGASYSGIDVDWLEEQLESNPSWKGKQIFLCCHYYQYNQYKSDGVTENDKYNAQNTAAFQELLAKYEAEGYKFVSMFAGHLHSTYSSGKYYIDSASKIPFLVSSGYSFNTSDGDAFADTSAWGFGVLEWNENEAHYYHVKYDRTYVHTDDGINDIKTQYKGAIENEMFLTY